MTAHDAVPHDEDDPEDMHHGRTMPCCGRRESALHTADCPSALAQDADDGDRTAVPDAYKEA